MPDQPKQRFSDVIGGLVSGVAYARSVADMESMRIAYNYLQHELLKGMSVPRLRIQRVSISLPIIVTEVVPGVPAERNPPIDIATAAKSALLRGIAAAKKEFADIQDLKQRNQSNLTPEDDDLIHRFEKIVDMVEKSGSVDRFQSQVVEDIEHAFTDLQLAEGESPSDASLRDKVGQAVEKVVKDILTEIIAGYAHDRAVQNQTAYDPERAQKTIDEVLGHEISTRIINEARHAGMDMAVKTRSIPPDFFVNVNTGDVKTSGGGPDVVTRLELVLREDGLEWMSEEHNGRKISKLTSE